MKIFALNLCLSFESALPDDPQRPPLLDWQAASAAMQAPESISGDELWVAAPRDPRAAARVFALQADARWRDAPLTWRYIFPDPASKNAFFQHFLGHFSIVEAAGGLVLDEREQALLILNRDKWSLPKGHIEPGESPESAARREVIEETGLQELRVQQELPPTWHTFSKPGARGEKWILKKTHWFLMEGHSRQVLVPQRDENIEAVAWVSRSRWREERFPTYPLTRFFLADHWL